MQKRGLIFVFTSIFLVGMINFASAQFYGGFSLGDILSSIDSSTMILGIMFIVVFAFLNYSLSRFFRDNKAIAGVISFAISLGVIWGINRTGLDFEGFFYTLGFSEGFLATIVSLALIGGGIYLAFKYGFGVLLTVIGGFFIILSFTDFIYETGTTFVIGALFLGIGIWLQSKKKRGLVDSSYYPALNARKLPPADPRSRQMLEQQTQQRQRTRRELQGKYNQYRSAAEAIVKQVGHIPKKGTPEYRKWKRYTQAVKTIENMASKQGIRLR